MAEKRIRENEVNSENIVTPSEKIENNWLESIFQKIQVLEKQVLEAKEKNNFLEKKLEETNPDVAKRIAEQKIHYWYTWQKWAFWVKRVPNQLFNYWYSVIVNDRVEKPILSITAWMPLTETNFNTWKRIYIHDIDVTLQDWTKLKMDILDFYNSKKIYRDFVKDKDIIENEDWSFSYTFRTEKFWTFTTKLIN